MIARILLVAVSVEAATVRVEVRKESDCWGLRSLLIAVGILHIVNGGIWQVSCKVNLSGSGTSPLCKICTTNQASM